MFQYKIEIDKKIIAILGPHLYGDTASIIAELVSNSHDACANNCWVTLKTQGEPEIIIEDDGEGMTPDDVNDYFLDIGRDRRQERPKNCKHQVVFGRKGIGKLAAFSLAKRIELYSTKDGRLAGCLLDYDKITNENKEPEAIPDDQIVFNPGRLSSKKTGTKLVLKDIQKDIRHTYYYLINRLVRNFNINPKLFKIHIAKNDDKPRTIQYSELNFFSKMDTILTIGKEFSKRADEVKKNKIRKRYKRIYKFEEFDAQEKEKIGLTIPVELEILVKGAPRNVTFDFNGWIGSIQTRKDLKGLIMLDGATTEEEETVTMTDNRLTIFSRKRIGEYDILPKVQTEEVYDSYIIGEIYVDVFEEDELEDMAISNRRGYEETDQRYSNLIANLKPLVRFIVNKKREVQELRKQDADRKEAVKAKKEFLRSKTSKILHEKLTEDELKIVQEDQPQYSRALQLTESTRRIMISSKTENKEYGLFIIRIFELLGLDRKKTFLFTSDPETGVPQNVNIFDYLKECFRKDMYVIFLFSRDFYDSNVCVSETGAAWATNKNHSNIVIDVDFKDIDDPIDNSRAGLVIRDIEHLNLTDMRKFVKTVFQGLDEKVPSDADINRALERAISEFRSKLVQERYYPKRKFQGVPVCANCGNNMAFRSTKKRLFYVCKCGYEIGAEIN